MAELRETLEQFALAWRRLQQRWRETGASWHDIVRWRFERERWTPLEQQSLATLREIERLAPLLDRARRSVK